MVKAPVKAQAEEQARIVISWDSRRKDWLIEISSQGVSKRWYWWLRAETTAELDEGTGWLLAQAVKEALEAQLY